MAHATVLDNVKMLTKVERTYAESLFELTEAAGSTVEIGEELIELATLISQSDEMHQLLTNPAIGEQRRGETIDRLFQSQVSPLTWRFLRVLNAKGRLEHLVGIAAAFDQLVKTAHGEIDVRVITATPLDDATTASIANRLTEALGRTAIVRTHVDPSLIAGLKIEVGDRLIDGSAATRLANLQKQLTAAAREWAREKASEVVEE